MIQKMGVAISSLIVAELLFSLPYHAVNEDLLNTEKMVFKEVVLQGSLKESVQRILKKKEDYRKIQALTFRVQKVFFTKMTGISAENALKLAKIFMQETRKNQLEPAFVLALIEVESNFIVDAKSSQGAVGLMQLLPNTAKHLSEKYLGLSDTIIHRELIKPEENIRLGIQYLGYLRKHLKKTHKVVTSFDVLASYLIGPDKYGKLKLDPEYVPQETLKYFNKIERRQKHWLAQL